LLFYNPYISWYSEQSNIVSHNPFILFATTIVMNQPLETVPDEVLAQRAKAGDRLAFEVLCDRSLPAVYNRLRALLPPEAVEDVTQEVFLAVVQAIPRYQQRASFRTWITGITRHKVADYYRQRGRQPVTSLEIVGEDPPGPEGWEEQAAVRLALRELPDHYQDVLLLRFSEALSFEEIAGTLHINLEAAKSRYRRALAALGERMKVEG